MLGYVVNCMKIWRRIMNMELDLGLIHKEDETSILMISDDFMS